MRLTPIEIRQHRFHSRFRGFDVEEVRTFLEVVVGDFEEVVRENAQLRREAERLARELDSYRSREQTIQQTLTTAQTIVDELKRTAVKESEVLVAEAELKSEKLMQEVREERARLMTEISEMRHMRSQLEIDLSKTLEGYLSLIEAFRATRDESTNGAGSPTSDVQAAEG